MNNRNNNSNSSNNNKIVWVSGTTQLLRLQDPMKGIKLQLQGKNAKAGFGG
jgi:hypothetical protein